MTLYRCDRLNASISERQCGLNRLSCFSCQGCPGLGEPVTIEGGVMASVLGDCAICGRKGLMTVSPGKCGRCFDRIKKGKDPVTGQPKGELAVESAPTPSVAPVCDPIPASQPGHFEADAPLSDAAAAWGAVFEGLVDQDMSATVNPPLSPLCRLLDPNGWLVEIPRDLSIRLDEVGIQPDDIIDVLEMLLDGELRRVA